LVDQIFNDLPSFWQGEFVEAVKDLLELWGHDLSLQEWQAAAIIAQGLLGFGDDPQTPGVFSGLQEVSASTLRMLFRPRLPALKQSILL
jgi:O-methyltransferase involved in polyketide biosynthesis